MSSLKKKAVGGIIWTGIETVGQYFIQFIITVILARILNPKDFGIIEMLLIFTAISNVILDSGFSQALIRKKDVTNTDFNSVFYFNITLGILLYTILYFVAPLIASFYKTPELIPIARVIFLVIIINSFSIIHTTIITTKLNFKLLTRASIFGALLSAFVGISLAKNGFGVWSLVFQSVSFALFKSIILWFSNKWRPSLIFNFSSIRALFRFSSKLLMVGMLDVIFTNLQTLFIGRMYSKIELGLYSQAKRFQSVPSNSLTMVIQKATYPILSKIQNEDQRLKVNYQKIIKMAIFIVCPLMLFLLAIGDRLFIVALTPKWLSAVTYFQPLCLVGVLFPLYSINLNIITAKGEGKVYLKVGILKRIVTFISIILTVKFGVLSLVWGQVVATLINSLITMYYSGMLIKYSMLEQIKDIIPIFLISILTSGIIFFLGTVIKGNNLLMLLAQFIFGLIIYFTFSKLTNSSSLKEITSLLESKFGNLKLIKIFKK